MAPCMATLTVARKAQSCVMWQPLAMVLAAVATTCGHAVTDSVNGGVSSPLLLQIQCKATGVGCSVSMDGQLWLPPSLPRLFAGGKWHSVGESTSDPLLLCAPPRQSDGDDALGRFKSTSWDWCLSASDVNNSTSSTAGANHLWTTSVRVYDDNETAVLEQTFPSGATGTQVQPPGNTS
jgi:hypothetical protein